MEQGSEHLSITSNRFHFFNKTDFEQKAVSLSNVFLRKNMFVARTLMVIYQVCTRINYFNFDVCIFC